MNNTWTPSTTSERLMAKIASKDPSVNILVYQVSGLRKLAAEQETEQNTEQQPTQKSNGTGTGGSGNQEEASYWKKKYNELKQRSQQMIDWKSNWKNNIQDLGIGAGTGLATYGITSLIPGSDKHKLLRALASIAAGGTAAYYGPEIRAKLETAFPGKKTEVAS